MHGRLAFADAVNWDCSLARGLVSWWIALPDQQRGLYWRDLCGRNHGTLDSTMTPAADWRSALGRPGGWGCLDFDSVTNEVVVSNRVTQFPCTIAAWVRLNTTPSVFHDNYYSFDSGSNNGYRLSLDTSNRLCFTLGGVAAYIFTTLTATAGEWCFTAATVTGSGGTATGYLNTKSESSAIGTMIGSPNQVSFGGITWGDDFGLNGQMDDVFAYDRALSASEVLALYNDSRRGHPEMLNWIRPTWYLDQAGGGGGGPAFTGILGGGVGSGTYAIGT